MKIILTITIALLIGFAIYENTAEAQVAVEKCPVCPVCTTSLVKSLKAEIEKHQLMVDAGFTDKDIENIIADKENILQIIR